MLATKNESILGGQRAILAKLAQGLPLREILDGIARYSEDATPEMLASILYYEPESGKLRRGGHNTLPDAFADAVDGLEPGPCAGSCGTAAFHRERVVSFDVQVDPLWEAFREFAASHGIRSAWSTPLISPVDDSLLGVFGMYYPDTRNPSESDLELVDHFTHLAAIAIELHRRESALRESERQRHQGLIATVAGLAHEINTPLGVALTAESILEEAVSEAQVDASEKDALRSPIRLMRENIERATKLLGHFRESVIEQSFDEVREVDVAQSVSGIVTSMRPLTDSNGLDVQLDAEAGSGLNTRCSPERLTQVLSNLVLNTSTHAYGDDGGPLNVSVSPSTLHPEMIEIVVQDQGRGMSQEERMRCTEPFYTTRRPQGSKATGLGLFMVKRIVEAELHGTLLLDTEPDAGVRWTVLLPREEGANPSQQA